VSPRDRTRAQLVEVAAQLLATAGPDAVTTRSVALAAGVQAPTIYRLFGDKSGLLDAVVEHGFASYMARKHLDADSDPVQSLRAGWELHVGFGLANPELFRLMHTGCARRRAGPPPQPVPGCCRHGCTGSPRRDACA
jgi:AcrR family transcriptional regulator